MNTSDLVPVFPGEIDGQPAQVVDARTLHAFLESGEQFADWIKSRIEKYEFVENQDFTIASKIPEAKRGGHNRKDYVLSLGMAKELSMIERNPKGRQARRYFIECERRAQESGGNSPELDAALSRKLHQMAIDHHERARALLAERVRQYRSIGLSDAEIVARLDRDPLDRLGLVKAEDLHVVLGRLGDVFNLINDLADPGPDWSLKRIAR